VEQKVNQQMAQEIEEHLRGCDSCRTYFEVISSAMLPGAFTQSRLMPDPYLPTRIRARAKDATSSGRAIVLRWSLRAVAFSGAVLLGIYMGEELSYQPSIVTDQHIISEYSNYLGESGIGDRWQTVALTSEVVSK
jgi:predicted anti-sigma-YlaC factor YlaD